MCLDYRYQSWKNKRESGCYIYTLMYLICGDMRHESEEHDVEDWCSVPFKHLGAGVVNIIYMYIN